MISRETVIGDLSEEDERCQFDDRDSERLNRAGGALAAHMADLMESIQAYIDTLEAPVSEDSASEMVYARRELIEKWAFAQAALSKTAWIIRTDGQEAFARLAASLKVKSKPFIVSDL